MLAYYKALQFKNLIIFSSRKRSYIPFRNKILTPKPLKQDLSGSKQKLLLRPEASNQLYSLTSHLNNVIYVNNERRFEVTISNNLQEPLLSINELYSNPSIGDGSQQQARTKKIDYIQMPIKQARLLTQRIYKFSGLNFQVDKSVASLCMDQWTETRLESGLIQQL
jgi:hypothetical protein